MVVQRRMKFWTVFLNKDFLELTIFELKILEFQWRENVVKDKTRQRINQRQGGEKVGHVVEMICVAGT